LYQRLRCHVPKIRAAVDFLTEAFREEGCAWGLTPGFRGDGYLNRSSNRTPPAQVFNEHR
jgi:hypothetical protein